MTSKTSGHRFNFKNERKRGVVRYQINDKFCIVNTLSNTSQMNVNDAWLVPEHTQCNMNFLLSIMPFIQPNIAIKMVSYLTYLS